MGWAAAVSGDTIPSWPSSFIELCQSDLTLLVILAAARTNQPNA